MSRGKLLLTILVLAAVASGAFGIWTFQQTPDQAVKEQPAEQTPEEHFAEKFQPGHVIIPEKVVLDQTGESVDGRVTRKVLLGLRTLGFHNL